MPVGPEFRRGAERGAGVLIAHRGPGLLFQLSIGPRSAEHR